MFLAARQAIIYQKQQETKPQSDPNVEEEIPREKCEVFQAFIANNRISFHLIREDVRKQ